MPSLSTTSAPPARRMAYSGRVFSISSGSHSARRSPAPPAGTLPTIYVSAPAASARQSNAVGNVRTRPSADISAK